MRLIKTGLLVAVSLMPAAYGEDPVGTDTETERANVLYAAFAKTADGLEIVDASSNEKYERKPVPLSKFTSQGTIFGSVFLWLDSGNRPAAIGTIGSVEIRSEDYEFIELHLLKPQPIEELVVNGPTQKRWTPDVQQLNLQPIPGAPKVAANERLRLVQMRSLFRQFQATMSDTNKLRPQPTHIYRYENSTAERDGAIFAFVFDRGTDPELLLRIESKKTAKGTVWHYQPIRFNWTKLTLTHHDKKVWEVEEFAARDSPSQLTPYITGLTKIIP